MSGFTFLAHPLFLITAKIVGAWQFLIDARGEGQCKITYGNFQWFAGACNNLGDGQILRFAICCFRFYG